eukprot:3066663-Rhodomonas_salina.1
MAGPNPSEQVPTSFPTTRCTTFSADVACRATQSRYMQQGMGIMGGQPGPWLASSARAVPCPVLTQRLALSGGMTGGLSQQGLNQ